MNNSRSSERHSIRAYDFRKQDKKGLVRISCRLDGDIFPDELWFDVSSPMGREFGYLAVEEPNWAAVALAFPAMMSGRDLVLEADISPRLLHALNCDLQGLLLAYDTRLKPMKVYAGVAPPPKSLATGVATGFSAGIDSFATLLSYVSPDIPDSLRLTHLTVHNVGALGNTPRKSSERLEAFQNACQSATSAATEFGLGTLFISSNVEDIFDACKSPAGNFKSSHSLRSAAVAHVLHDFLSYYLYSSGVPYRDVGISVLGNGTSKDTAYIDPILLPLLSSERLTILSALPTASRGEKTKLVAKNAVAQAMLVVCAPNRLIKVGDSTYNCSRCSKCVRTLATLEALGELDHFDHVFQVEWYRANRIKLLQGLVDAARAGDKPAAEAVDLSLQAGLRVPAPTPSFVKLLKKIRKRLLQHRASRN
jgi:hypothetical protein